MSQAKELNELHLNELNKLIDSIKKDVEGLSVSQDKNKSVVNENPNDLDREDSSGATGR